MALTKVGKEGITGISNSSDATAITIDSSENVGIGTASPDTTMHIHTSSAGTVAAVSGGVLTLEKNNHAVLQFLTPNDKKAIIYFGDPDDIDVGRLEYDHSSNSMLFNVNAAERQRIDSSGNLLVGTTNATGDGGGLELRGNTENGGFVQIKKTSSGISGNKFMMFARDGSVIGSVSMNGTTAVAYNTSSDYRLKENVVADWDATTRLKQLNPVRFNFIADTDRTVDGFLAHEVQAVVPEAITGTKDAMRDEEYEVTPSVLDEDGNVVTEAVMGTRSVPDYQGIDQGKLVPLLVKTIQELEARITALETE